MMRSASLSADLVETMAFERLVITEPIFDLAYATCLDKMHPIAQLVVKAKAFVTFRTLSKEALITTEESSTLFEIAHLSPDDLALLKKSDIDHIKLHFS